MEQGGVDKNDHSSSLHLTLDCGLVCLQNGTKAKLIHPSAYVVLIKMF